MMDIAYRTVVDQAKALHKKAAPPAIASILLSPRLPLALLPAPTPMNECMEVCEEEPVDKPVLSLGTYAPCPPTHNYRAVSPLAEALENVRTADTPLSHHPHSASHDIFTPTVSGGRGTAFSSFGDYAASTPEMSFFDAQTPMHLLAHAASVAPMEGMVSGFPPLSDLTPSAQSALLMEGLNLSGCGDMSVEEYTGFDEYADTEGHMSAEDRISAENAWVFGAGPVVDTSPLPWPAVWDRNKEMSQLLTVCNIPLDLKKDVCEIMGYLKGRIGDTAPGELATRNFAQLVAYYHSQFGSCKYPDHFDIALQVLRTAGATLPANYLHLKPDALAYYISSESRSVHAGDVNIAGAILEALQDRLSALCKRFPACGINKPAARAFVSRKAQHLAMHAGGDESPLIRPLIGGIADMIVLALTHNLSYNAVSLVGDGESKMASEIVELCRAHWPTPVTDGHLANLCSILKFFRSARALDMISDVPSGRALVAVILNATCTNDFFDVRTLHAFILELSSAYVREGGNSGVRNEAENIARLFNSATTCSVRVRVHAFLMSSKITNALATLDFHIPCSVVFEKQFLCPDAPRPWNARFASISHSHMQYALSYQLSATHVPGAVALPLSVFSTMRSVQEDLPEFHNDFYYDPRDDEAIAKAKKNATRVVAGSSVVFDDAELESDSADSPGSGSEGAIVPAKSGAVGLSPRMKQLAMNSISTAWIPKDYPKHVHADKSAHLSAQDKATEPHTISGWANFGEYVCQPVGDSLQVYRDGWMATIGSRSNWCNTMDLNNSSAAQAAARELALTFNYYESQLSIVANNFAFNRDINPTGHKTLEIYIPAGMAITRLLTCPPESTNPAHMTPEMIEQRRLEASSYVTGGYSKGKGDGHVLRVLPFVLSVGPGTVMVILVNMIVSTYRRDSTDAFFINHAHTFVMQTTELYRLENTPMQDAAFFLRHVEEYVQELHDKLLVQCTNDSGEFFFMPFEDFSAQCSDEMRAPAKVSQPPAKRANSPGTSGLLDEEMDESEEEEEEEEEEEADTRKRKGKGKAAAAGAKNKKAAPAKGKKAAAGKGKKAAAGKGKKAAKDMDVDFGPEEPAKAPGKGKRTSLDDSLFAGNFSALSNSDVQAVISRKDRAYMLPFMTHHTVNHVSQLSAVFASMFRAGLYGSDINDLLLGYGYFANPLAPVSATALALHNGAGLAWNMVSRAYIHGTLLDSGKMAEDPYNEALQMEVRRHRLRFAGFHVTSNHQYKAPGFLPAHGGDLMYALARQDAVLETQLNARCTSSGAAMVMFTPGATQVAIAAPAVPEASTGMSLMLRRMNRGPSAGDIERTIKRQQGVISDMQTQLVLARRGAREATEALENLKASQRTHVQDAAEEEEGGLKRTVIEKLFTTAITILDKVVSTGSGRKDRYSTFFNTQIAAFYKVCTSASEANKSEAVGDFENDFLRRMSCLANDMPIAEST